MTEKRTNQALIVKSTYGPHLNNRKHILHARRIWARLGSYFHRHRHSRARKRALQNEDGAETSA